MVLVDSHWEKTLQRLPTWLPALRSFEIHGPLHANGDPLRWVNVMMKQFRCESWNRQYTGYVLRQNDCPTLDPYKWEQERLAGMDERDVLGSMSTLPQSGPDSAEGNDSESTTTLDSEDDLGSINEMTDLSSGLSESGEDEDEDRPDSLDELSEEDSSDEQYDSAFDSDDGFSSDEEDWCDGEHFVTTSSNAICRGRLNSARPRSQLASRDASHDTACYDTTRSDRSTPS